MFNHPFSSIFLPFLCVFGAFFSPERSFADKKLVIIGDSLTEGLGVASENAYPNILEKKLKTAKYQWTVINAGVSGATTASALSRAKWLLNNQPDLVLIALGANDGLRAIPVEESKKNLKAAIDFLKSKNIKIILVGNYLPPNYGANFSKQFKDMFSSLAKTEKIKLIPFLLLGVAGDPKLNQADGIHPNEKGHEIMANTVYSHIKDQL